MTQFSVEWILSLNWLSQNWGQVQRMARLDCAGNEVEPWELLLPPSPEQQSLWIECMIARCFQPGVLCSAQPQLVEPFLQALSTADEGTCQAALISLTELASSVFSSPFPASPSNLQSASMLFGGIENYQALLVSSFGRSVGLLERAHQRFRYPNTISACLLFVESLLNLRAVEEGEILAQMTSCRDREHALVLCSLLGSRVLPHNLVSKVREEAIDVLGAWGGVSAGLIMVVWARDEQTFDSWDRSAVARLWEETSYWVGAMNTILALPAPLQVRAIKKLLMWRIIEPERALDLALQLLKAQFAPDLVVLSSEETFQQNDRLFSFAPHPRLPLTKPISQEEGHTLKVLIPAKLVV